MPRKWLMLAGVGLLAAVLLLAVAVPAFAQNPTPTPTVPNAQRGWGRGLGMCFGGSWDTYDAAAKALGLTPEQLFAELHSGKTLDQIATDKGVDIQKVKDAIKSAQVEAQKAAIQQAVKDGKLTQEQADWLLKGTDLGFMPFGRGMGRGFRFGGGGKTSSSTTAPSTSPSVTPSSF